MNKIISLLILATALMLITGCAQKTPAQADNQPTPNPEPNLQPATTPPEEPSTLDMNALYSYEKLSEFEYKLSSNEGGQQTAMSMKYKISSDTANGKAAWLQQSDLEMSGTTATNKMWLDKSNLACLKILTTVNVAGQTMEQESQCPTEGPNSATAAEAPLLKYVGKESVTVPAGTFNAKKYESEGMTFWTADNVPLPIKVVYGGEAGTLMDLVNYK